MRHTKKKTKLQKKIFQEPIINSGDNKWLIITKEETFPLNNRHASEIIKNPLPPEEKVSFAVIEPSMWKCNKCGDMIQNEDDIPYYCTSCSRSTSFTKITKNINPDWWKLPKWEDIPIDDIDMLGTFDDILSLLKQCIVFPEQIHYKIVALWILSSWKVECFDTVPFLIFRGLIETGKTRALDVIRELGYRMMQTTGVTFPAMCRSTHYWNAGILIDEIDNKVDKRTEDGRKYLDFLKPSYKRGSTYTTADKDSQDEIKVYKNYGFKAFAGEKGGYDVAIFSRSIDFQMEQEYPEITEIYYVKEKLDKLQTILLNYRYKFNDPQYLSMDFPLIGRDREIFSCLIRTAEHVGISYEDIIEYIKKRKTEAMEEIQDTDEYLILKAIKQLENTETLDDAPEMITYSDIAQECGWELDSDDGKKKRQRLGYIFKKKLLLKTKRTKKGYALLLNDKKNQRKLKSYNRRYKI